MKKTTITEKTTTKVTKETKTKTATKIFLKTEINDEQRKEIKEAFDAIDTESTGKIDINELKEALMSLGLDSRKEEVARIIEEMEKSKNGLISFEEFINLLNVQIVIFLFKD